MALTKRGEWWYGESQADIPIELTRFGKLNGYTPTEFANAVCDCGNHTFRLRSDENEGVAVRICTQCRIEHPIADSNEYLEDATVQGHECICGKSAFEITVGLALYYDAASVRCLSLGCRCPACGITGCYADWKTEFEDFRALLVNV